MPGAARLNENFPGSVQTQVTGLNDKGGTVGFWSSMNNASQVNNNYGWWSPDGKHFYTADYPASAPASPPADQLLGINNAGLAVGFYADASGSNHGYTYDTKTGKYKLVTFPSGVSSSNITAAAINNNRSEPPPDPRRGRFLVSTAICGRAVSSLPRRG